MKNLRILVVVSDADSRGLVEDVATRLGAEHVAAQTGEEALAHFDEAPADIAVLSSHPGQLDVSELTTLLKRRRGPERQLPVLVLGSDNSAGERARIFDGGADDYLPTPPDAQELQARLVAFTRTLELRARIGEAMEEIENLATTDQLTGAYGRRFIHSQARIEWNRANRYGEALSVISMELLDLDKYRIDKGGETTDAILKEATDRLSGSMRRCDLIARDDWSRFLIVMPNTSTVGAYFAAEKIRNLITLSPFQTDDGPVTITIAVGVGTYQDDNFGNPEQLLDSAHDALRQARAKGPGSVVLYHPTDP